MLGPIWLNWFFASLMIFSALFHVGRLMSARLVPARPDGRAHRHDDDLTHLVMSSSMAAMLVISFGAQVAIVWSVIIGVPTLWFILRAVRALTSGVGSQTSGGTRTRAPIQPLQQVSMCAAMLFMFVVAGASTSAAPALAAPSTLAAPAAPAAVVEGMVMGGGHASHASPALDGSISSVAVTSLVFVVVLCLVAARHVRDLRVAVATKRAWPMRVGPDLRQRAGGLVLAPGLSLGCQLAMSATMIYMLVLMV